MTTEKMKKAIQIITLTLLLGGCVTAQKKMNTTLNDIYRGMDIVEFRGKARESILVDMLGNYECYKLQYFTNRFDTNSETRFFYFRDNKLYKIDVGERATDLKIEIENEIKTN